MWSVARSHSTFNIQHSTFFKSPSGLARRANRGASGAGSLLDLGVVLGVRSDPAPEKSGIHFHGKSAVMETNAQRPNLSKVLEAESRMAGMFYEQFKGGFRAVPNIRWQLPKKEREVRARVVVHNLVLLPWSWAV